MDKETPLETVLNLTEEMENTFDDNGGMLAMCKKMFLASYKQDREECVAAALAQSLNFAHLAAWYAKHMDDPLEPLGGQILTPNGIMGV